MPSVGQLLLKGRQDARLSVRELSERTRIKESILLALERDDFGLVSGEFYRRAFLRAYAREVGLDVDHVLAAYGGREQAPRRLRLEPVTQAPTGDSGRVDAGAWAAAAVRWAAPCVALAALLGLAYSDCTRAGGGPENAGPAVVTESATSP